MAKKEIKKWELKKGLIILAAALLTVVTIGYAVATQNGQTPSVQPTCQESYKNDARVKIGPETIDAEVADEPESQQRGLGGRQCIGPNQGMLFIFDEPGQHAFWMKDMEFPIDMVWLDGDGRVVKVQANVSPDTYPETFTNDELALYVLELQAGRAGQLGIEESTILEFQFST